MANEFGIQATVGSPVEGEYTRSVYANVLNLSHTPHDFRLTFSMLELPVAPPEADGSGMVVLRPRVQASVIVPPSLMPAMIDLLQKQLEAYEAEQTQGGGE
jgi:hypothetical protein